MHYHPITDQDRQEMLEAIGVASFEDLVRSIPAKLRNPTMDLPEALSEMELQTHLRRLGAKNTSVRTVLSFLGGGSYEHFIPAAVAQTISRHEFYTAYTPYQAEASQGTLQTIYEYQSFITELTGLDVSNASHYDGATSMAEAALLALKHTDRTTVLVSKAVHPHYRQVLKTYFLGTAFQIVEIGSDASGRFDRADFEAKLTASVACAIFQTPNFFGTVEDLAGVSEKLHAAGALLILAANPLSLAILKSPGEWGADIAVGDGQPFGLPLQLGGPYLGYFAVSRALVRRIPGRLVGMTVDSEGRRAFCLTLQAREQHIRRERAASNICSNQALCALAANVFLTLMGKVGIRELAEINLDRAEYLRAQIAKLKGFRVDTTSPIFNEFVVTSDKPFSEIRKKLFEQKILAGIGLEEFYPERKNQFLVCATETKTKEDLDRFVEALKQC